MLKALVATFNLSSEKGDIQTPAKSSDTVVYEDQPAHPNITLNDDEFGKY